jgi:hypothetical protein
MAEAGERALLRSGALNKLLEPEAASLPEMGPRTPAGVRVRAGVREAIEHFGGASGYWSALDGSFRRLLLDLAAVAPGYAEILGRWRATVDRAAGDAFEDALTAFPAQPFALAAGETIFRQALRRYLDAVA